MQKIQNYINGKLTAPLSGKYIDNYNPATGQVYSLIPDSDEQDVALAVIAAEAAFPLWSAMRTEERSELLIRLCDLI